jgi:hypothetical protein
VHDDDWEYATDAARRYLGRFARMLRRKNVLDISKELFDRRSGATAEF